MRFIVRWVRVWTSKWISDVKLVHQRPKSVWLFIAWTNPLRTSFIARHIYITPHILGTVLQHYLFVCEPQMWIVFAIQTKSRTDNINQRSPAAYNTTLVIAIDKASSCWGSHAESTSTMSGLVGRRFYCACQVALGLLLNTGCTMCPICPELRPNADVKRSVGTRRRDDATQHNSILTFACSDSSCIADDRCRMAARHSEAGICSSIYWPFDTCQPLFYVVILTSLGLDRSFDVLKTTFSRRSFRNMTTKLNTILVIETTHDLELSCRRPWTTFIWCTAFVPAAFWMANPVNPCPPGGEFVNGNFVS